MAPPTYRIRLERETDGKTLYQWSGIPTTRVRPLLRALDSWAPLLGRVANAKRSLTDLLSGIRL